MKYGFYFVKYEDCSYILYMLQKFKIEQIRSHPITIEIVDDNGNIFILSQNISHLSNCDKVFQLFNNWKERRTTIKINDAIGSLNLSSIYVRPGENIPEFITDDMLKQFLDDGNICISSSTISFNHDNFISDYALNMYHFYNLYGYSFLNFYTNFEKNNLVGVYYQPRHASGALIKDRTTIYEKVKSVLNEDLHIYHQSNGLINKNYHNELFTGVNYFSMWDKNFVTSYTDYNTSVCSMIFETHTTLNGEHYIRDHITEKTLKFLLFSGQCNIFFIWIGSPTQYKFLKENNLWALNFEFLPDNPTREDIFLSAEKCASYLKSLKEQLVHNNAVYLHLLKKYDHHLLQNKNQLALILNNCSMVTQNKLLNLLKGGT